MSIYENIKKRGNVLRVLSRFKLFDVLNSVSIHSFSNLIHRLAFKHLCTIFILNVEKKKIQIPSLNFKLQSKFPQYTLYNPTKLSNLEYNTRALKNAKISIYFPTKERNICAFLFSSRFCLNILVI